MRRLGGVFLAACLVLSGCLGASPAATPIKAAEAQAVQAQSLKRDIQEIVRRATSQDEVVMGEAGKAKSPADQARLIQQAYHILLGAVSEIHDRASGLNLNPFEARLRAEILEETAGTLWKLRYLDKEGSAKVRTDDERLAHVERLHQEAYAGLGRVSAILGRK